MSTCRHVDRFNFFQHVVGLVQNFTWALPMGIWTLYLPRVWYYPYLLELWDTGPHQDPARKKDKKRRQTKKRDDRWTDRHAKLGQKKTKNEKSANGRSAGRHWIGGKKGGKDCWDPEIIFGGICSFSIIGNDETKFQSWRAPLHKETNY
jgi:hypothetical protein